MWQAYHRMINICAFLLLWVSLQACGGLSDADLYPYRDHALLIHKDGQGIRLPDKSSNDDFNVDNKIPGDELKRQLETTIWPKLVQHAKDQNKTSCTDKLRVLVFIHGGLNDYVSGAEHMSDLLGTPGEPSVGDSDAKPPLRESCYYPIFINWNSSLGDSVGDDLMRIRFGQASKWWWAIPTAPAMVVARLLGSIMNLPVSLIHNSINVKNAVSGALTEGDPALAVAGDVLVYLPLQIAYTVTIPVGEGFGAPGWELMKRRVDLAVEPRLEQTEHEEGAARILISQLRNWLRVKDGMVVLNCGSFAADCPTIPVELTLVGHSMGTMLINHLLDSSEAKGGDGIDLPVKNIVYMAPAATIGDTEHFLIPYLKRHPDSQFWLFILNERDEAREIAAKGGTFLFPRGSLLTWIDTFLESEADIGQSTLGSVANLRAYYVPPPEVAPRETSLEDYFRHWWSHVWNRGEFHSPSWYRLSVAWPLHDHEKRIHAYESRRQVWLNDYPAKHADFTQPRFFKMMLCEVDPSAFRSQDNDNCH